MAPTGRALTTLRAGLALNMQGSLTQNKWMNTIQQWMVDLITYLGEGIDALLSGAGRHLGKQKNEMPHQSCS